MFELTEKFLYLICIQDSNLKVILFEQTKKVLYVMQIHIMNSIRLLVKLKQFYSILILFFNIDKKL